MSEEHDEPVSTSVSVLIYCKMLSDSRQEKFLELTAPPTFDPHIEEREVLTVTSSTNFKITSQEDMRKDKSIELKEIALNKEEIRPPIFKSLPLFPTQGLFLPETQEESLLTSKETRKRPRSPTRIHLTLALESTKQRLYESKSSSSKRNRKKGISRGRKRDAKPSDEIRERIQPLTRFLDIHSLQSPPYSPDRAGFDHSQSLGKEINLSADPSIDSPYLTENQFFDDVEPFPFSTLNEWLIWHHNFPEYAHVRETFNVDDIPDVTDLEIFWVNIKDEPEFFNSMWEMVGSKITDISTIKFAGFPEFSPEWTIGSAMTDGFTTLFMDVYQLLLINPKGLRNYRYPILQFALKGLTLLDSTYRDATTGRWYCTSSREEMEMRLKVLDQFVNQQETPDGYERTLDPLLAVNKWYSGIIGFDLVAGRSTFLKEFTARQTGLTEDVKIQLIKKSVFNDSVTEKLVTVKALDTFAVQQLLTKLKE